LGLGLRRLTRAVAGAVGTCVVAGLAAAVTVAGTGAAATATDQGPAWSVTVGPASHPLFPGTDATMAYEVRNDTSGTQRLRATTAQFKNDGDRVFDSRTGRYVDGCQAGWFRVAANDVAVDVDVVPGATVHGTLTVAFDMAPMSQDVCRDIGFDVVVSAS